MVKVCFDRFDVVIALASVTILKTPWMMLVHACACHMRYFSLLVGMVGSSPNVTGHCIVYCGFLCYFLKLFPVWWRQHLSRSYKLIACHSLMQYFSTIRCEQACV